MTDHKDVKILTILKTIKTKKASLNNVFDKMNEKSYIREVNES